MPFLEPDVIKLDLQLIQARTTIDTARIVNAVMAQAQRSGALVLAEGIETPAHEELARSMGAHLGQGWLYGRPAPLPHRSVAGPLPMNPLEGHRRPPIAPWELVHRDMSLRRARKPLLNAMSRHLERQIFTGDDATVLLGTIQHAAYFTGLTARRYAELAQSAFLVAAFGAGGRQNRRRASEDRAWMPTTHWSTSGPWSWCRRTSPPPLIAHDIGDHGSEVDRRFDYVVTFDRGTVLLAASSLMRRMHQRRDH